MQIVDATLGPIILARLEPHADILDSVYEIARSRRLTAGIVLDITGSLEHATLQRYAEGTGVDGAVSVVNIDGPMEASGHGMIGVVDAPGHPDERFGKAGYRHGEPYMHVHLTVTTPTQTIVGHAMRGCRVRSHGPITHFTIAIAPIPDAALRHTMDFGPDGAYRGVYHMLESLRRPTAD